MNNADTLEAPQPDEQLSLDIYREAPAFKELEGTINFLIASFNNIKSFDMASEKICEACDLVEEKFQHPEDRAKALPLVLKVINKISENYSLSSGVWTRLSNRIEKQWGLEVGHPAYFSVAMNYVHSGMLERDIRIQSVAINNLGTYIEDKMRDMIDPNKRHHVFRIAANVFDFSRFNDGRDTTSTDQTPADHFARMAKEYFPVQKSRGVAFRIFSRAYLASMRKQEHAESGLPIIKPAEVCVAALEMAKFAKEIDSTSNGENSISRDAYQRCCELLDNPSKFFPDNPVWEGEALVVPDELKGYIRARIKALLVPQMATEEDYECVLTYFKTVYASKTFGTPDFPVDYEELGNLARVGLTDKERSRVYSDVINLIIAKHSVGKFQDFLEYVGNKLKIVHSFLDFNIMDNGRPQFFDEENLQELNAQCRRAMQLAVRLHEQGADDLVNFVSCISGFMLPKTAFNFVANLCPAELSGDIEKDKRYVPLLDVLSAVFKRAVADDPDLKDDRQHHFKRGNGSVVSAAEYNGQTIIVLPSAQIENLDSASVVAYISNGAKGELKKGWEFAGEMGQETPFDFLNMAANEHLTNFVHQRSALAFGA